LLDWLPWSGCGRDSSDADLFISVIRVVGVFNAELGAN
jgi:hypothetical protein